MKKDLATFAGGCFWCQDAVFRLIEGVLSIKSGYSGGESKNPTYEEVSGGDTGHREAIQIEYDLKKVSYKDLLGVFWTSHDPTQKGGQGADIGPQYEAAIFYHNEEQKKIAQQFKQEKAKQSKKPIYTEILPYRNFYEAELYHQDFYSKNPDYSYSKSTIKPKVEKTKEKHKNLLKNNIYE